MPLINKKSSILKSEVTSTIVCPKCNKKQSTKIVVSGRYKHFLQLPLFSIGKYGKSTCSNCNQVYQLEDMPNDIKLAYFELKETTKTPVWHYSGLILVKLMVILKIISRYF